MISVPLAALLQLLNQLPRHGAEHDGILGVTRVADGDISQTERSQEHVLLAVDRMDARVQQFTVRPVDQAGAQLQRVGRETITGSDVLRDAEYRIADHQQCGENQPQQLLPVQRQSDKCKYLHHIVADDPVHVDDQDDGALPVPRFGVPGGRTPGGRSGWESWIRRIGLACRVCRTGLSGLSGLSGLVRLHDGFGL